jgi:succinoglycan biosynthesis protein ExoL
MRSGVPKVLVLAHILSDAAIHRRVRMLQIGGAQVKVAGFRRAGAPVPDMEGCDVVDLGQTYNGGFVRRILAVLWIVANIARYRSLFEDADIILARNLEMLAIGARGRALERGRPTLIYECLDIHRLMLGHGAVSRAMRGVEGWLSQSASALFTSSRAFVDNYFKAMSHVHLPVRLIENKLLADDAPAPMPHPTPAGPPWVIGWFGILRCRQSLLILADLVRESQGAIRVVMRGRPALDQMPDFYQTVEAIEGLDFLGPYQNPDDLQTMYEAVHFIWAIDMYEEGLNSSWLLPNRLYESGYFATVPLALETVETGRYLKQRGLGVLLSPPLPAGITSFFKVLAPTRYGELEQKMIATPCETWVYNTSDCSALVDYMATLPVKSTHG